MQGTSRTNTTSFRVLMKRLFQAFLHHSGLADNFDVQQLADRGTEVHVNRNTKVHASDAQLRKDAKKMGAFVDMLNEDMPYECALVTHFDWVARHLFTL